jgi:DNA polymerase-1
LPKPARTSIAPPPPKCSAAVEGSDCEERRYAKTINFGLIYGMSAFGLAQQWASSARGAGYIDRYFTRYPGVAALHGRNARAAKEEGYVETVFGRRLWLPEIRSSQCRAGAAMPSAPPSTRPCRARRPT